LAAFQVSSTTATAAAAKQQKHQESHPASPIMHKNEHKNA